MTQYPPQPAGQPWGQSPEGLEPTGQPEFKAARPWYKKKRFIIPAGLLALFVAIGALGGGEGDPDVPSANQTTEVVEATPDAEASASAAAEAAASAAAAEAEASAAAAEAEAERLAAEQAAAEAAAAEAAAAEAEAAAAGTVAQQNALRSAEDYLDFTAFSRSGLITQLEFEGFSTEDATWAVDRVTVDWNEQAAQSAKDYLDFTSFSRSGLIDQLIFEGFTPEQAEYGVSQTGL